jgi:hypothetical protein
MRVVVNFQDEGLEFELPRERLVASWRGPAGIGCAKQTEVIRDALEKPRDYPPLRQMVVPGDRVVVAFDPTIPEPKPVLAAIWAVLEEAAVAAGGLTVLTPPSRSGALQSLLPQGSSHVVHDPGDRSQLAYLASTREGRRIYLNRLLTDADVVLPVGRLGYDPILGYRGPWSILFPELSDRETMLGHRSRLPDQARNRPEGAAGAQLDESFEVSWLLGSQFHLGLLPGATGLVGAVAGRETSVRDAGIATLEHHWRFRAPGRAELVVIGIGHPEAPATIESLADGLAAATRLVQHGGKIVVLSRASGEIGRSFHRLMDAGDPKNGAAVLRGHEADDDYLSARQLAQALSWADVYVSSSLEPQLVEDLSLIALEHPEQARRLVDRSGSCSFVSHADLTYADAGES